MVIQPDPGYYARLLRYDAWANAETLRSLRIDQPPAKAVRWLGHIIGAGALWLARVRGEPSSLPVWPDLSLDQCERSIEDLADGWLRYFDSLGPIDLDKAISYRNSQGEDWTSTVGDILTHLAMHGSYHRAQIAAALRESGHTPAYTDFIHAVRRSLVQ